MTNQDRLDAVISALEASAAAGDTTALPGLADQLRALKRDGLDFQQIVEHMDESLFVTDGAGKVLYVNPAYTRNTGVTPEDVLGRSVFDIVQEGRVFTGGASCDVIRTKQRVFRLSTTYKTDPPLMGYAVGVPVLDGAGELTRVVVSSRPISTLRLLQDDFDRFVGNLDQLRRKNPVSIMDQDEASFTGRRLIGSSHALNGIWNRIRQVASTDATVLITGESGVGKEVVADELYRHSLRAGKPYIKVNCAAIPASLLESELFGYDKGAFSGASASGKPGLFELADGGTLLLDEIGDLSPDLQAKLLRAIQNREISRVGGTKSKRVDVRFISLTNANLREKVAAGTFRSDLFYRLNVIPIRIPPLRERREDIPELIEHFVGFFGEKYGRPLRLSRRSMDTLRQYNWPGNIREMENALEYLTLCCPEDDVMQDEIISEMLRTNAPGGEAEAVDSLGDAVARYERTLIEQALCQYPSLRSAAEALGVNASTLSRKARQYGIHVRREGRAEGMELE